MLNGIAFLITGSYLAAVILNGRLDELLALLKTEEAFIEWAIAVAVLAALYRSKSLGPIGHALMYAAMISLAYKILQNDHIKTAIADLGQGKVNFLGALMETGATKEGT